jgi:rhodanese-related sulfurtransferase
VLVDVRPIESFAAGHPVGALSIPLRPAFASWLGWLAPHDRRVLILREPDQDPDEILWPALKIGYDNLEGELAGGIDAWGAAGLPVAGLELIGADRAGGRRVLDIRQESEFASGHLPGAVNVELGTLPDEVGRLADEPTVVMCGHGERAMGAASILQAAGFQHVSVLEGGPDDLASSRGVDLEATR